MRDDPGLIELVHRARDGDEHAWNALVDRFAPLVWSVCQRYRLGAADAGDAAAATWLRLVEHLPRLREPAALPGWLATTAARECLQLLRSRRREVLVDEIDDRHPVGDPAAEAHLLLLERQAALRTGLAELGERCRRLLTALFADPPATYAQISADLDMAVGAIGPTRQRCLQSLRNTPALLSLAAW